MADNEVTINNQTESGTTVNVDTKSLVGVDSKTVHRQVTIIGSPVTFGRVAEVNANSELLVKHTDSIAVTDNAGSLTVDAPAATPVAMAITNTSDALVKAGDAVNNAVRVNIVAGSSSGTEYTEDVASVADPIGSQLIARRRDALATETTTDGDNTALNSTGKGELYVKHADSIAITSATLATEATLGTINTNIADIETELATKLDEATYTTRQPVQGQAVMASSVPVVIASNQSAVPVSLSEPISVDDNGSSLTVDNAGTFAVQDSEKIADNAGFTDGTTKVLPVGLIYDEVAGTGLTENDIGTPRMNVNRSAIGIIEDGVTRARYATVTAANALKVDGSAVTQPISGSLTAVTSLTQFNGQAISLNTGVRDAGTLRVTVATNDVVPVTDNSGSLTVDQGTAANLKAEVVGPTADNAANPTAKVSVLPAVCNTSDPTYTNTNVNPLSVTTTGRLRTAVGDWIGSTAPTVGQKTMANSIPVVLSSDHSTITVEQATSVVVEQSTASSLKNEPAGNVADAAGDSGNPIKIGLVGRTTNRTAVTDGQRVNAIADDLGRQVVVLSGVRDLIDTGVNASAITNTTETTILPAIASTFQDVVAIIISNSSGVGTLVQIRDTTGGTVIMNIYSPATSTVGASLPHPIPQTTVNTNWTAQAVTTASSLFVTMQYVKNV